MKTYTLSELANVDCLSVNIEYNTLAADVLTLSGLAPEWVDSLGWERWEKIVLTNDPGVPLFVGRVTEGAEMAAQGGSAPRANFTAKSDFAVLEMTAYTAINAQGIPTLASPFVRKSSKTPTASMSAVLASCFNGASSAYMTSTLQCSLSGVTIPLSQTGGSSCAQLMLSALEWAPNAIIRMGYEDAHADGSGLVMHISKSSSMGAVSIEADGKILLNDEAIGDCEGLTDISLRPRPDLVLPAAAIIGAQHFAIGGSAKTPGAFVYCVTREKNETKDGSSDSYPASTAPNEKKTIISGLAIPTRTTINGQGYRTLETVDQVTHKFLAHCFPILSKIGEGNYSAGAPLLSTISDNELRPDKETEDEDAKTPANYDTSFVSAGNAFVHVDGAFPASSRKSRNISGLKWCKAQIKLIVAIDSWPSEITQDEAKSFFKGTNAGTSGKKWKYTEITIDCNIINHERRIVKGVSPLSSDPEFSSSSDSNQNSKEPEPNYKTLIQGFYNDSQMLYHEGNITLLSPTVHPGKLLGRIIRIKGKHPDWESMNAICQAISYDLASRKMTLSLGSRDVLGWDMRLERAQMAIARTKNQNEVENISDPLTDSTPEDEKEEENMLMVSPSINAFVSTFTDGKAHKPFEVYKAIDTDNSDEKWVMQGGTVWIGKKEITIPSTSTQIKEGEEGTPLGDPKENGRVSYRVYRKDAGKGKKEWTYDITQKKD